MFEITYLSGDNAVKLFIGDLDKARARLIALGVEGEPWPSQLTMLDDGLHGAIACRSIALGVRKRLMSEMRP